MSVITGGKQFDETATQSTLKERVQRTSLVFAISLMIAVIIFTTGYFTVRGALFDPVSIGDTTDIPVTIEKNSSVSSIAKKLSEAGVLKNETVFKVMLDFYNQSSNLKAGEYVFNKTMSTREIINKLANGEGTANVVEFTTIEGNTISEMAVSLEKQGMFKGTEGFLSLCQSGREFMAYDFVNAIPEEKRSERRYVLEGYLAPNTFEIYLGSTTNTVIDTMLSQFNILFTQNYMDRAEELDMSIDEVITLASIIEKEGKEPDFKKVSAVFHKRLERGMKLESCATVHYALNIKRLNLSKTDIASTSKYNTYVVSGLPIGPICNPSQKAIEAALYYDEDFYNQGYLFFCSKDPESGELAFSKTSAEHSAQVDQYRPLWESFDKKNNY